MIKILILIIITSALYLNTLVNKLVWDDHLFLESWTDIQSFSNIPNILKGSSPPGQGKIFRPIRGLIYVVNYKLWGANPFYYHLQALLLHVGITVLVYLITAELIQNSKFKIQNYNSKVKSKNKLITHNSLLITPFITALLFGLHPIHTETINYIATSMETWGTLFFFISFYFYLRVTSFLSSSGLTRGSRVDMDSRLSPKRTSYSIAARGNDREGGSHRRNNWNYYLSIAFATLAFFTYEMTLTLPVLIVLYELCFRSKSLKELKSPKVLKLVSPYFILALGFVFIRVFVLGIFARQEYLGYSFYLTMLTMVKVFARYVLLLIFPINQTVIHNLAGEFPSSMIPYDKLDPILNQTIFDIDILASIGLLLGLILIAIKYYKVNPFISFCIGWFFISLMPVSYIIPHGGAMAEKYLYIASFGFVLFLGYSVQVTAYRFKKYSLVLLLTFSFFLLTFYFYQTFNRNKVWANDISLFSDVVKKSPNNLIANYTLGIWYGRENKLEEAKKHYQVALKKASEFWEARLNLANIFLRKGDFEQALAEYKTILKTYPDNKMAKNIVQNLDFVKSDPDSYQLAEGGWIAFRTTNIQFSYPIAWRKSNFARAYSGNALPGSQGVALFDPSEKFQIEIEQEKLNLSVEEFIRSRDEDLGELKREGQALIPQFDHSFVKVFDQNGTLKMKFYLFKDEKVVKVLVYPADSPNMKEFDNILSTIQINLLIP